MNQEGWAILQLAIFPGVREEQNEIRELRLIRIKWVVFRVSVACASRWLQLWGCWQMA